VRLVSILNDHRFKTDSLMEGINRLNYLFLAVLAPQYIITALTGACMASTHHVSAVKTSTLFHQIQCCPSLSTTVTNDNFQTIPGRDIFQ
jgi:hypothetical protein